MPRGGARPGAGRKPSMQVQLVRAQTLLEKFQADTKAGLDLLATRYSGLMGLAVTLALGGDKEMLKLLIPLLPKIVPLSEEGESPFDKLTKKWGQPPKELHLHQHIEQPDSLTSENNG